MRNVLREKNGARQDVVAGPGRIDIALGVGEAPRFVVDETTQTMR